MGTDRFFRAPLAVFAIAAGAALGVAFSSHAAFATAELDRMYALDSVGALRAIDNVDGLFADYVASAYKEYFATQTRFRLQDLSKADALIGNSRLPYAKAAEDPEILGQLSRSLKVESLLRTKIFKEGPRYRFTIEWLHSPHMEILATETFNLEDQGAIRGGGSSIGAGATAGYGDGSPAAAAAGNHDQEFAGLGDIKEHLKTALGKLFAQVPFIGQVTGRDQDDVTVNLGAVTGIHRGDTLVIGTIDEVKRHPLLHQIVEWRVTDVGKIDIDSVDEALAFGHVTDQQEGHEISRYQKVLRIIPRPEKPKPSAAAPVVESNPIEEAPHIGFGMVSLWTGYYGRDFSSTTTTTITNPDGSTGASGATANSGSGFLYGARASGEVWLNREFFFDLALGYGAFGFSQSATAGATGVLTPASTSYSGSIFTLSGALGYTYLITGDFFGPRAWLKVGYGLNSYTLPALGGADQLSPYSIKSLFLDLGGDLPLRDGYGARLDLTFGLFNSGSQTGGSSGSANSSNNASISVSGYYRYKPRVIFLGTLEIQGTGSEFGTTASLSQKTIAILPSVEYLF